MVRLNFQGQFGKPVQSDPGSNLCCYHHAPEMSNNAREMSNNAREMSNNAREMSNNARGMNNCALK